MDGAPESREGQSSPEIEVIFEGGPVKQSVPNPPLPTPPNLTLLPPPHLVPTRVIRVTRPLPHTPPTHPHPQPPSASARNAPEPPPVKAPPDPILPVVVRTRTVGRQVVHIYDKAALRSLKSPPPVPRPPPSATPTLSAHTPLPPPPEPPNQTPIPLHPPDPATTSAPSSETSPPDLLTSTEDAPLPDPSGGQTDSHESEPVPKIHESSVTPLPEPEERDNSSEPPPASVLVLNQPPPPPVPLPISLSRDIVIERVTHALVPLEGRGEALAAPTPVPISPALTPNILKKPRAPRKRPPKPKKVTPLAPAPVTVTVPEPVPWSNRSVFSIYATPGAMPTFTNTGVGRASTAPDTLTSSSQPGPLLLSSVGGSLMVRPAPSPQFSTPPTQLLLVRPASSTQTSAFTPRHPQPSGRERVVVIRGPRPPSLTKRKQSHGRGKKVVPFLQQPPPSTNLDLSALPTTSTRVSPQQPPSLNLFLGHGLPHSSPSPQLSQQLGQTSLSLLLRGQSGESLRPQRPLLPATEPSKSQSLSLDQFKLFQAQQQGHQSGTLSFLAQRAPSQSGTETRSAYATPAPTSSTHSEAGCREAEGGNQSSSLQLELEEFVENSYREGRLGPVTPTPPLTTQPIHSPAPAPAMAQQSSVLRESGGELSALTASLRLTTVDTVIEDVVSRSSWECSGLTSPTTPTPTPHSTTPTPTPGGKQKAPRKKYPRKKKEAGLPVTSAATSAGPLPSFFASFQSSSSNSVPMYELDIPTTTTPPGKKGRGKAPAGDKPKRKPSIRKKKPETQPGLGSTLSPLTVHVQQPSPYQSIQTIPTATQSHETGLGLNQNTVNRTLVSEQRETQALITQTQLSRFVSALQSQSPPSGLSPQEVTSQIHDFLMNHLHSAPQQATQLTPNLTSQPFTGTQTEEHVLPQPRPDQQLTPTHSTQVLLPAQHKDTGAQPQLGLTQLSLPSPRAFLPAASAQGQSQFPQQEQAQLVAHQRLAPNQWTPETQLSPEALPELRTGREGSCAEEVRPSNLAELLSPREDYLEDFLLQNISKDVPDNFLDNLDNISFEDILNESGPEREEEPSLIPTHTHQPHPPPPPPSTPAQDTKKGRPKKASAQQLNSETELKVPKTKKPRKPYIRKKDRPPAPTSIPPPPDPIQGGQEGAVVPVLDKKKVRKPKKRKTDISAPLLLPRVSESSAPLLPPDPTLPPTLPPTTLPVLGVGVPTKPKRVRKPYVRKKKPVSLLPSNAPAASSSQTTTEREISVGKVKKSPSRQKKSVNAAALELQHPAPPLEPRPLLSPSAYPDLLSSLNYPHSGPHEPPLPLIPTPLTESPVSTPVSTPVPPPRSSVIQSTFHFPTPTTLPLAWNTSRFTSQEPLNPALPPLPPETYAPPPSLLTPSSAKKTHRPPRPRKPRTKKPTTPGLTPTQLPAGTTTGTTAGTTQGALAPVRGSPKTGRKSGQQKTKEVSGVRPCTSIEVPSELLDFVLNPPTALSSPAQTSLLSPPAPPSALELEKRAREEIVVTPIMIHPEQEVSQPQEEPSPGPRVHLVELQFGDNLDFPLGPYTAGPGGRSEVGGGGRVRQRTLSSSSTSSLIITPVQDQTVDPVPSTADPFVLIEKREWRTETEMDRALDRLHCPTQHESPPQTPTHSHNSTPFHSLSSSVSETKRRRGRPPKQDTPPGPRRVLQVRAEKSPEKSPEHRAPGGGSRGGPMNPGFKWVYSREELETLYKVKEFLVKRTDLDLGAEETSVWSISDGGRGSVILTEYEPFLNQSTHQLFHVSNFTHPLPNGSTRKYGTKSLKVETCLLYQTYMPVYVTRLMDQPDMSVVKYWKDRRTLAPLMYIYQSGAEIGPVFRDCLRTLIYQATDPRFLDRVILDTSNTSPLISRLRSSWAEMASLIKAGCMNILKCPKWKTGSWIQFMKYSRTMKSGKNLDKSKRCVTCMIPSHAPHRLLTFHEPLYNSLTLEQIPDEECDYSDRPLEGIPLCSNCTTMVRDFHSLYHVRFHLLATVQLRVQTFLQSGMTQLSPTNLTEHLLNDTDWYDQTLLDFQILLARARKDGDVLGKWAASAENLRTPSHTSPKKENNPRTYRRGRPPRSSTTPTSGPDGLLADQRGQDYGLEKNQNSVEEEG